MNYIIIQQAKEGYLHIILNIKLLQRDAKDTNHSNGNYVSYNFMNKISLEYMMISNIHCVFMVGSIIFIILVEAICFIFRAVLHHHSQSAFFCDCGVCPIKSQMTLHHRHFLFLPLENSSFAFQHII